MNNNFDTLPDILFLDFDGVLTDNRVQVSYDGHESVSCSRADGLAFDVFKKIDLEVLIISTEKNKVVKARAQKLGVECIQNVAKKDELVKKIILDKGLELSNVAYVGNDLNDYHAMQICGYRYSPIDAHEKVKLISTKIIDCPGGFGVVRNLAEEVFGLDILTLLYGEKKT